MGMKISEAAAERFGGRNDHLPKPARWPVRGDVARKGILGLRKRKTLRIADPSAKAGELASGTWD